MYIYTHTHTHNIYMDVCIGNLVDQMCVCVYTRVCVCVCVCVCVHNVRVLRVRIYIYIYIYNICTRTTCIWMYIQGNLVDQMCKGIDKTCIFIAIMTQMYIDKCAGNILYIS